MKRIDVQKELKKILTSNMTTGEILRMSEPYVTVSLSLSDLAHESKNG